MNTHPLKQQAEEIARARGATDVQLPEPSPPPKQSGLGQDHNAPLLKYLRELPASLAKMEEILPVEEDHRTGEIDAQLQVLEKSIEERRMKIENKKAAIRQLEDEYQHVLLQDESAARRVHTSMAVGQDVIAALEAQQKGEQTQVGKLRAERAQIADDRHKLEASNRVSQQINAAKAEAKQHIEALVIALPRLRDLYRTLKEAASDSKSTDAVRLGHAADIVEANFRERVLHHIDGANPQWLRQWMQVTKWE